MNESPPPIGADADSEDSAVLAWYVYPEPTGTAYCARELINPARVRELFDYCQIALAIIHKEGWRFLFKTYGLAGILDINEQSEWFIATEGDDVRESVLHMCLIAGYDPITDTYGSYDNDSGLFAPTHGTPYQVPRSF